ncbi:MAG: site-2 protease family protein [Firmicutes bacterium]|nr:site-2 protease family protein [Bacillota bacterium]
MLYLVPAVLAAVILHELAHGVVARALGDPTAERAGRLTLNPLPHIDPVGFVTLVFFHFGWARPVPVDPRYFRHPYRDMVAVALAGPLANGVWAMVLALALAAVAPLYAGGVNAPAPLVVALGAGMEISVSLGLFNLLPVPPLDGSHFVSALWPAAGRWLTRAGFVLLAVLVLSGVVGRILLPPVLAVSNLLLSWAQAAVHLAGVGA